MPPLLLTPGPLTTHPDTRAAMREDRGSRDPAFTALDASVWRRLAGLVQAEDPDGDWVCVPVQGSGTFAVEAMLGTLVPRSGRLLVAVNGAYGRRMVEIMERLGRPADEVLIPEEDAVSPEAIDAALAADPAITHVAVVYSETTTGLVNPLAAISGIVAARGRRLLVDAMSAFGALPLAEALPGVDAVAASANKCLEGVPGVAFVLTRRAPLLASAGNSPSLSLDLHDQWRRREKDGQWRFTPPTHVIAALSTALDLHAAEGAVAGRGARYAENRRVLVSGMRELGFEPLLPDALQGPIIVTFVQPADPAWDFERVYAALEARGFAIYPGKLAACPSFRVGCIGQVFPDDLRRFVAAMDEVMGELGVGSGAPGEEGEP
ncbi:2-aminoethylphosphonate--pyruvate transaminase [Myxococcota bacterium]|nr:2-aminoethylphosphonate--pyruvate transaminase [Myxococcota bacterium]